MKEKLPLLTVHIKSIKYGGLYFVSINGKTVYTENCSINNSNKFDSVMSVVSLVEVKRTLYWHIFGLT